MSKSNYQRILEDKPIAYHPDLARISGSVTAGIFLSQLIYWSSRGVRKDGYIWKIQSEWEEETALSRYEQETARKKLKAKGILLEKKVGVPAKLHYKIDWKILNALLDAHYAQTSMRESHILESDNPADKDGEIPQAITESTTESTKEYVHEGIHTREYIPEPVAEMVTALTAVCKTPNWEKTETEYNEAAYMIIGYDCTVEDVKEFGVWWGNRGYYDGKPALSTLLNEWSNFKRPPAPEAQAPKKVMTTIVNGVPTYQVIS